MRHCPKCLKNFPDTGILYCRDDGTRLLSGPPHKAEVEPRTVRLDEVSERSLAAPSWAPTTDLKDALLITEFENSTGEPIFDQTLKTALAFSLAQSPFLDIVPDAKVNHTLRLMGRPNAQVKREFGEEICMRLNLKAFLAGSIASFGKDYVLTLEAVNARTGEIIGREFEKAETLEDVLDALSRAATGIRGKLGESLASIERFNRVGDYTTSSLQALKFFCLGIEKHKQGGGLESIPFHRKALEIDPHFASAYLAIAITYRNSGQWKLATEPMLRAYELRDKVSEREQLRIDYFYTQFVTGDMDKGIQAAELWKKTYPSTSAPHIVLSDNYERLGLSKKAVDVAYEGLAFDPHVILYSNLAESLLSLGRLEDVREICRQAFERGMDGFEFHSHLYQAAFIENDANAMDEHIRWFDGRNDEYLALALQAGAAGFQGRTNEAGEFSRRAIDLALRGDAREIAAIYASEQALRLVFWSTGTGLPQFDPVVAEQASTLLHDFLDPEMGKDARSRAALALALAGLVREAASLADELQAEGPKDTLLNGLWLPAVRAAIELQNGNAADAVKILEVTERFEKAADFYPQFLRGISYLHLGQSDDAVREFQKILDNRGEGPLSSVYPLAQLGKARATNNSAQYNTFFEMWKDADIDIPS
jgi:tetratricopeptide (TPR) repeat protein